MRIQKISCSVIALVLILAGSVIGQNSDDFQNDLFMGRGEIYFQFEHPGQKVLGELTQLISIDRVDTEKVWAYANPAGFTDFIYYGLPYEVLTPPSLLYPAKMKDKVNMKDVNDWDYYPTYEAYVEMMNQFAEDYPEICTVFSIGQSIEDRDILFVKISDNIEVDEGEPQFLYTSSIHGDETTGYVLFLRLIDYLLSNYGTDDEVDNLVNNLEIWINPLANPDGTYAGGNSSVNGATRYNANGVDLNRNYADPEDGPHPDGNEWQQETQLFMQLAEDNHFVMSANLHGGTEVCNYPWDTWAQLHADDDWWYYVCRQYADTVHANAPSGYMSSYDNGITNGYQWYSISGGRQDYMTYFHQCREFTLEISDVKLLPANQLPDHWDYNYQSLLNYMKQALFGVSGTVTDALTGDPVVAEVYISGHDMDSSWVYSDEMSGNYFRYLFEGTYDITFSAYGYIPQTIEDVSVFNEALTTLDVELESGDLIVDFTASETQVPVESTIDFSDLTFGSPVSWEWSFEGASPSSSFEQHPQGILYADEGLYDVSLTVSDGTNTLTVLKEDYISVSIDFIIENTTVIACSGLFYDTGGADEDYDDLEDFIMTFLPVEAGGMVSLDFSSFSVEDDPDCEYDWLKIYDGPSIADPLIGKYCGTNSPGIVTASNEDGALTFEFHSDYSVTASGWIASLACEGLVMPPVADFSADVTLIIEGQDVVFTDLSSNDPDSWLWVFEGGEPQTSEEQNPLVSYIAAGVYDVTLTVENSAGSNTITKEDYIIVDQYSGTIEPMDSGVQLFPNPTTGFVKILSDDIIQSIIIHDLAGIKIDSFEPKANESVLHLDELAGGYYILSLLTDNQLIKRKLQILK